MNHDFYEKIINEYFKFRADQFEPTPPGCSGGLYSHQRLSNFQHNEDNETDILLEFLFQKIVQLEEEIVTHKNKDIKFETYIEKD